MSVRTWPKVGVDPFRESREVINPLRVNSNSPTSIVLESLVCGVQASPTHIHPSLIQWVFDRSRGGDARLTLRDKFFAQTPTGLLLPPFTNTKQVGLSNFFFNTTDTTNLADRVFSVGVGVENNQIASGYFSHGDGYTQNKHLLVPSRVIVDRGESIPEGR
jgi:hypothetical protein